MNNIVLQFTKIWLVVLISLFAGLILTFLRLPSTNLDWLHPYWIVLILLYWALMLPQYVNVGAAWLVSLGLDMVYNVPLGENGLTLVLLVFFVTKFQQKIITLGFWKSSFAILILLTIQQLLQFLVQTYTGSPFDFWTTAGNVITSALLWPFLALFLSNSRKKLHV